jgi:hypothetical protein
MKVLPPLKHYQGPIATEEMDTSSPPEKKIFDLPTVQPFRKIGKNPDILARREDALTKGADAIEKAYLHNAIAAPRRLYEHTFPKELDLLSNTLSVFERQPVTVKRIYGYRLHRVSYQALVQILKEMRDLASDSFVMAGTPLPGLPSWGDRQNVFQFHDENDFEVLAVCFRIEVEHFLTLMDKYHNFQEGKPQELDPEAAEVVAEFK